MPEKQFPRLLKILKSIARQDIKKYGHKTGNFINHYGIYIAKCKLCGQEITIDLDAVPSISCPEKCESISKEDVLCQKTNNS